MSFLITIVRIIIDMVSLQIIHQHLIQFTAKKELAEGMISEKQFSQQNESCKELIKEASHCLRDEPIGTMEKVIYDNNYMCLYCIQ